MKPRHSCCLSDITSFREYRKFDIQKILRAYDTIRFKFHLNKFEAATEHTSLTKCPIHQNLIHKFILPALRNIFRRALECHLFIRAGRFESIRESKLDELRCTNLEKQPSPKSKWHNISAT